MGIWVPILLLLIAIAIFWKSRERFTGTTSRENILLGPTFTSYGAASERGPDSSTTNKYPELIGGLGNLSTRVEGAGITTPSKNWSLVADGSLPSSASLGCDENSKYLPFSRVVTDLEPATNTFKVSKQFEESSYSVKPEPSPFLTDFSAFFR